MIAKDFFDYVNRANNPLVFKESYKELALYLGASFLLPFVIPTPQILLGSLVNSILVLSAYNLKGLKSYSVAVVPSLMALLVGLLLGSSTHFIIYMLAGIWTGNITYITVVKGLFPNTFRESIKSIVAGSIAKGLLITGYTYALAQFITLPEPVLMAFGPIQIVTALVGGLLASLVEFRNKL